MIYSFQAAMPKFRPKFSSQGAKLKKKTQPIKHTYLEKKQKISFLQLQCNLSFSSPLYILVSFWFRLLSFFKFCRPPSFFLTFVLKQPNPPIKRKFLNTFFIRNLANAPFVPKKKCILLMSQNSWSLQYLLSIFLSLVSKNTEITINKRLLFTESAYNNQQEKQKKLQKKSLVLQRQVFFLTRFLQN